MRAVSKLRRRPRRAVKVLPAPPTAHDHDIPLLPELEAAHTARDSKGGMVRLSEGPQTILVDHSSALIDSEVVSAILEVVRWSADQAIVPSDLAKPGMMRFEALDKVLHHAIAATDEKLAGKSGDVVAIVHHGPIESAQGVRKPAPRQRRKRQ